MFFVSCLGNSFLYQNKIVSYIIFYIFVAFSMIFKYLAYIELKFKEYKIAIQFLSCSFE